MQMEPDLGFTVRPCEGAKVPSTGLWTGPARCAGRVLELADAS